MIVQREIRHAFIAIHDLLPPVHNIIRADIDEPSDPQLNTGFQNMAGAIYVHLINSTKLQHLFARHAERSEVEHTVGTAQRFLDVSFARDIPCRCRKFDPNQLPNLEKEITADSSGQLNQQNSHFVAIEVQSQHPPKAPIHPDSLIILTAISNYKS